MANQLDILGLLTELENNPESVGLSLRLDLATIILKALRERGWNQSALASAAGVKEGFISRLVHSDANCTFETAGRILFALGLRASLVATYPNRSIEDATESAVDVVTGVSTNGEEVEWIEEIQTDSENDAVIDSGSSGDDSRR